MRSRDGNEGKNCHVSVQAGRFVNPLGTQMGLLDVHRGIHDALSCFVERPGTFPAPGPNVIAGNGGSAKVRRMDEKLQSGPPASCKTIKKLRVTKLGVGTGKTSWINFPWI
jgi:hypothetical protein